MPWSAHWPVERWNALEHQTVFNELRAALAERDAVVPAGCVPAVYARHDRVEGQSPSGQGLGRMQEELAAMLSGLNPWRWWDRSRGELLTPAHLLEEALGRATWTVDLSDPASAWAVPQAVIFNELRQATNGLTCLRRLTAAAVSSRVDSVYDLTFGVSSWPASRAAALALFDGLDDGADTGLTYDVGLSATVFDAGVDQQWYLDARAVEIRFDTSALEGLAVARAWLELDTAASPGSTDFSDTFLAEVVSGGGGQVRGTFASDDFTVKSFELDPADLDPAGETVLRIRSARPSAADRAAWAPSGPDYSSTYREGFDLGATLHLVVEVTFDYRA